MTTEGEERKRVKDESEVSVLNNISGASTMQLERTKGPGSSSGIAHAEYEVPLRSPGGDVG